MPNQIFSKLLALIAFSIALISCAQSTHPFEEETRITPHFLSCDSIWVDSVFALLSTEEQIAQLLMVPIYSRTDTNGWSEAEHWVRDLGIGGVICMQGGPEFQRVRLGRLQKVSKVPLMVASDAEWGLGMRLDSTRSFPRSLTLGATRDPELVRRFGQVVGASLRRTGVHVNFAPVVDVNSNPANPVIGSRSFGENVDLVGELGLAYSMGLQDVNILATAKHFPGHGDSDSDSHKTLPTIYGDRDRLDSVELAPFRVLIDGGIGAMMIAHLDVPALDSIEAQPSTLSPTIVDTLLRQNMGFEGLVFTDALSMKGFVDFAGDRPRARDALLAGNDILLFPGDPVSVIEEISNAIKVGLLDSAMVAEKCKRVLRAKVWTQAASHIPSKGTEWEPIEAEQIHREILEESMTLLVNRNRTFPWLAPDGRVTIINITDKSISGKAYEDLLKITLGRSYEISSFSIGKDASGWGRNKVKKACLDADLVIINFLESSNRRSRSYGINKTAVSECAQRISQSKQDSTNTTKWVVNVFANPYCLNEDWATLCENTDGLLMAYQDDYRTQEAAVDALVGVGSANGILPVTPPGSFYREGDGLGLNSHVGNRLGWNKWSCEGNWGPANKIDSIVNEAIQESAMPGCRVVVAHKGRVMHDGVYGTTDGNNIVEEGTVYDLASITKIAATSLCLMEGAEKGWFELDEILSNQLGEFDTLELGNRTFREILSHQAGLYPWIPFYLETLSDSLDLLSDKPLCNENVCINPKLFICTQFVDTMYKRISNSEIRDAGEYRYSDLGYYLIHKILNNTYDCDFAVDSLSNKWFYEPLGLYSMGFNPLEKHRVGIDEIAPTEIDTIFRKRTVQGYVHDPGAALLGGVCGHAGLFSDAHDLTRLGQMLLNGGTALGHDFFSQTGNTVEDWTSRAYTEGGNRRGIGFDKPALDYDEGPTCNLSSKESFGHSGFTGTLLWVDPTYDLVYVFLSNRTYPDTENKKLITLDVRTEIQRVIMEHFNATLR